MSKRAGRRATDAEQAALETIWRLGGWEPAEVHLRATPGVRFNCVRCGGDGIDPVQHLDWNAPPDPCGWCNGYGFVDAHMAEIHPGATIP